MKKILVLAAVSGMVAANAVAIDVIHNIGMENYTAVCLDSDLPISPKAWSLDDALTAQTRYFAKTPALDTGLVNNLAAFSPPAPSPLSATPVK